MENNTKETQKKSKRLIWIIASLVGVVAITGIYMMNRKAATGPEALEKKLVTLGKDFYENFYYDNVTADQTDEQKTEFFSRFSETGIKINLDNLGRFNDGQHTEEIKTFINDETKTACDINNTRAVITPKAPYGKTDYDISAELDCGYESTKVE